MVRQSYRPSEHEAAMGVLRVLRTDGADIPALVEELQRVLVGLVGAGRGVL